MTDSTVAFADGEAYERMMGRWSRLVADIFLAWLAPAKAWEWLDVGCGNGAFTETLIRRCAPVKVTGVDPSEAQLEYARKRPGVEVAQFELGDAQALPFADRQFDAATMALVISFLPDPPKAISEMKRVVKPGGRVAAYMWDIPAGGIPTQPLHRAIKSLGLDVPLPPSSAASSEPHLRAIWEGAGLADVETRQIRIPVRYSSFAQFWETNRTPVGPLRQTFSGLSQKQRERLRDLLQDEFPLGLNGE